MFSPGELKTVEAKCNADEIATGGGYAADPDIIVYQSHDLSAYNQKVGVSSAGDGWIIAAKNTGTGSQSLTAEVNCLKLVG